MTIAETVTAVAAIALLVVGVAVAIVVDVRAHGHRPWTDRVWLVLPAAGMVALVVAVVS